MANVQYLTWTCENLELGSVLVFHQHAFHSMDALCDKKGTFQFWFYIASLSELGRSRLQGLHEKSPSHASMRLLADANTPFIDEQ